MFDKLDVFRMAQGLAGHSAARTAAIAENIANADTPGYRATDLRDFAELYDEGAWGVRMRRTRAEHSSQSKDTAQTFPDERTVRPGALSPNGNNVSLEQEMMSAAAAMGAHDRALAIYRSALTVLRTAANGGN